MTRERAIFLVSYFEYSHFRTCGCY